MHTFSVFLPNEFDKLADKINEISIKKNQSTSATIRDMLCEYNGFEPVRVRQVQVEIKNRRKNRPKLFEK